MNKRWLLLLALVISTATGWAQGATPQWTQILSNSPETFQTKLISSSENSITVNVQVPGFYTVEVSTPRGEAKIISLPKAVSTAQAGEPDVPMTGVPAIIDDRARMGIRVLEAKYKDFENIEIAPSKGAISRQKDPATVPYTYGDCYSQDAFFPASQAELYDPYIVRDYRGQNMAVKPFVYNPLTKTLRVYYDLTLEMYKVDDNGDNILERKRGNNAMDPDFKSMYQRHFINWQATQNRYTPVDEEGDLLIICHDAFLDAMTDFVNWKKTRGVNTTIVGTSTAGTTNSAIKTYIKNQYNANNNLTHVLLVGDVAQIPGNSFSAGGSYNGYDGKGDNLYGQIVGNDIYNDLFIGRFSAISVAQVTTQVQKVINYERDLTAEDTWLQKALGISRKENGNGHNNEDDYQHIDNIRQDLLNYGYSTVYQRYANLSGYTATSSQISTDINNGVGIINYANHGQETAWGANESGYVYYANSHVNNLTNYNKLPFIFSVACLVGKYDHSTDCFAETWMRANKNSKSTGAVGTMMSYISQPWIPPMWAQDEFIDILVESYANNIKHTWGGTAINGIMGIFDHFSTTENAAKGTYQAWILYGDPSMMLRTKTPQAMMVSHEETIAPDSESLTVTVEDGDGALATLTDASHNILDRATVADGKADISIDSTLDDGMELTLCVFGYNKVTYLGTVKVELQKEWKGDGTAESPYIINNTTQMNLLAQRVNDGEDFADTHFLLNRNLTYDGTENNFTPVGSNTLGGTFAFNGFFDGNGKTIEGINVYKPTTNDDGMSDGLAVFGVVGQNGTIQNLNVANSSFTGFCCIGGVAGQNHGTISGCTVADNVTIATAGTESIHHGGVVGYNCGTVSNCISSATLTVKAMPGENDVTGDDNWEMAPMGEVRYQGGIVGTNKASGTVTNCFSKGTHGKGNGFLGAVVGLNEGGTLADNYYYGCSVEDTDNTVMTTGIGCGGNEGATDITDNNGAVEVHTLTLAKDIVSLCASLVEECDVVEPISLDGNDYYVHGTTFNLSYTGMVSGEYPPVFSVNGEAIEENSFVLNSDTEVTVAFSGLEMDFTTLNEGDSPEDAYKILITEHWDLLAERVAAGTDYSGKFFQLANNIVISTTVGTENTPFAGTFDGDGHSLTATISDTDNQGTAPFRYISDATIKNLTVEGTVTGTTYAAGLVGFAWSGNNNIEDCMVNTAVEVTTGNNQNMGGVVGNAKTATITLHNTIFNGSMSNGSNYAGGLLGWSDGCTLTIDNCLFSGTYTGEGAFHPIALQNKGKTTTATIDNCYYTEVPTLTEEEYIAANGIRMYKTVEEVADGGLYTKVRVANSVCFGKVTVTMDDNFKMTGEEIKPVPEVATEYGMVIPQEDNYTLEWSGDGTASGVYTVTITAGGNEEIIDTPNDDDDPNTPANDDETGTSNDDDETGDSNDGDETGTTVNNDETGNSNNGEETGNTTNDEETGNTEGEEEITNNEPAFQLMGSKTLQYTIFFDGTPTDLAANAYYNSSELRCTPGYGETKWNVRYKEIVPSKMLWDFEDENNLDGWNIIDKDGDGENWFYYNDEGVNAHSGTGAVLSASYDSSTYSALSPDNWLITPQITLNGTFSFWAVAQSSSWTGDAFAVYVYRGTTCPTSINLNDWTQVLERTEATSNYTQYAIDLSQFEGQLGYVAIRHYDVTDKYYVNIDDVELELPDNEEWITLENVADNPFLLTGLKPNSKYNVQVQAVLDDGAISEWTDAFCFTTGPVTPELTVEGITNQTAQMTWTTPDAIAAASSDEESLVYNLHYREWEEPITTATVTLTVGDVWGDGSGYQMLLDADGTAYGSTIPTTGGLTSSGNASASVYNQFEYKIPENADGAMTTSNIVFDNSITIEIPAGTYDWCITNPTPNDRIWIAGDSGNVGGRQDDYVFEAGKHYTFTVIMGSDSHDQTDVTIEDLSSGWTTVNGISEMSYIISELLPATTYEVQVQTVYGANVSSNWSNVVTFTTLENGGVPTDLTAPTSRLTPNETWYTVDGRKLNGKPTAPGVYIRQGTTRQKITIK